MATYTCDNCGMSVNMTCATCDAELVHDTITTDAGVEVHYLSTGMYTGIRPAGTNNSNRVIGYFGKRSLQTALHSRKPMGLNLPAMKVTAVVFNAKSDAMG